MTAWYNENDDFTADWLEKIIACGLIAPGVVDRRSIVDVRAAELADFTQCHFFAGIGGWSYALRLADFPDTRPVWTGSCPCQPFSQAGQLERFSDERHLWPTWVRLIKERRPPIVFGEQVASATEWLRLVRGDLEALDYAVGCSPIEAASAGADHLRDRYWFVADANFARSQGRALPAERAGERAAGQDGVANAEGERRREVFGDVSCQAMSRQGTRHAASCGATLDMGFANGTGRDAGKQTAAASRHGYPAIAAGGGDMADAEHHGQVAGANLRSVSSEEFERPLGTESQYRQSSRCRDDGSDTEWVTGADGKARRVKSGVRLLAHGIPNRVGLLRGFGNAIDPRPAAEFIRASVA